MTLATKSVHDKEFQHNLSSVATIIIILTAGLGIGATIAISTFITTTPFPSPQSSEEIPISVTDLGSVNGFVISSSGLPVSGASLLVYKHMGLTGSADMNSGYSTSVTTDS